MEINTITTSTPNVQPGNVASGNVTSGNVQQNIPAENAAETPPAQNLITDGELQALLKSYGLKPSAENLIILQEMLARQLPLDKDTILNMSRAMKLSGSVDMAAFIVSQDIPVNSKNIGILQELIDGRLKLTDMLNSLTAAIDELADGSPNADASASIKEKLLSIFQNTAPVAADATGRNVGQPIAQQANQGTQAAQQANQGTQTAQTQQVNQGALPTDQSAQAAQAQQTNQSAQAAQAQQTNQSAQAAQAQPTNQSAQAAHAQQTNQIDQASQPQTTNQSSQTTDQAGQTAQTQQINQSALASQTQQSNQTTLAPTGSQANQTVQTDQTQQSSQAHQTNQASASQAPQTSQAPQNQTQPQSQRLDPFPQAAQQLEAGVQSAPARRADQADPGSKGILADAPSLKGGLKELDDFYNRLSERLSAAKDEITRQTRTGGQDPELQKVFREIVRVQEFLDFTAQIKNQVYVQIPLQTIDRQTDSELFVFRDKKKKFRGGQASALIALDTASLGRFEAYIQKNDRAVTCQFRIRDQQIKALVAGRISQLEDMLGQYQFNLSGYSFLTLEEPFHVTNKEPPTSDPQEQGAKKYFIDVKS